MKIRPHLAIPERAGSITRRFQRGAGYQNRQVIRERVEEMFGWGKTPGRPSPTP